MIYAADHRSPYINHQELTYRFHLFMLAIIYNATAWPCVINIPNSNYISSTRHSVLLEQHTFVSKNVNQQGQCEAKEGMKITERGREGEREGVWLKENAGMRIWA